MTNAVTGTIGGNPHSKDAHSSQSGLRVPFGRSTENGRMYAPREVPLGKACECECPACKRPLYAKHCLNSSVTPHFQHAPGDACQKGLETALHLAAKQLIEAEKRLFLPRLYATLTERDALGHDHERFKEFDVAGLKVLQTARLEEAKDGFRPDVVATLENGQDICVEIAVTHFVDAEKLERVRKANLPLVEFDLSGVTSFTWDSLRAAMFEGKAPSVWQFHPHVEEIKNRWLAELREIFKQIEVEARALAEELALEDEEQAEQARVERTRHREQERREQQEKRAVQRDEMARAARFKGRSEHDKGQLVCRGLGREHLPEALRASVAGARSFGVGDSLIWQSALFGGVVDNAVLKGHCYVHKDFALEWLKQRFVVSPAFPDAEKVAVWKYLVELCNRGALQKLKHGMFGITIANLAAFETLQHFRAGKVSISSGLEWAMEEHWPYEQVTVFLATAHATTKFLPDGWSRVATILPGVRGKNIADIWNYYSQFVESRHLMEYWISAGFVVSRSGSKSAR